MKKKIIYIFLLWLQFLSIGCSHSNNSLGNNDIVKYEQDDTTVIKNPGMGWMLYDDANNEVASADEYWLAQDKIANKYATTFYVRWRWSDMEPEEGRYAWLYDENYKKLINGALDRGLKLAFRVYVNGQDNLREGTPKFVFDAGCSYHLTSKLYGGDNRSPYVDDSIFQEKYENFIRAFAKEYDNASIVDYIDGFNLGWWGEGHHIICKNNLNANGVYSWLYDAYGEAFKNVLLVTTLPGDVPYSILEQSAYKRNGFHTRRDGFASKWFSDSEKEYILNLSNEQMIIAEACYWGTEDVPVDPMYSWGSWADYYKQVVDEALYFHANYLDARTVWTSQRYMNSAEGQLVRFAVKGGYRILPTEISVNEEGNNQITINHKWKNIGVGFLPNNDKRWNYKYKVSFALINDNNEICHQWIVDSAKLYDLRGSEKKYEDKFNLPSIKGTYKLCVAIVDATKDNQPAINLAIKDKVVLDNGWYFVKNFNL